MMSGGWSENICKSVTSEGKEEAVMVWSIPALLTQAEAHNGKEGNTKGGFHDGLYISPPSRNILLILSILMRLLVRQNLGQIS